MPNSVLSADEARELFVPWTIEGLLRDGSMYGVPTDVQTLLLLPQLRPPLAVIGIAPLLLVFFMLQRQFVEGITLTGMK